MIEVDTKYELSKPLRERIDKWMQRYPKDEKRSAVMTALYYAQEEHNNWLSVDVMNAVADYLGMPHIAVYEVATFYSLYNLKPVGRHIIDVCTNVSCMLANSNEIVEHIKKTLQIDLNETTADGKFTLRVVECLAACKDAPMFQIGKKYYENLTPAKVDKILKELE
jgi:NADH-quinone oxidoreductase subunit E